MRKSFFLLVIFIFSAACVLAQDITQGSLYAVDKKGKELGACPLKRTIVTADVSGFITRVKVVQEFENNFNEPIEAVYTFPLSNNSAVDDMTMRIGERTIRGRILPREEARKVYEDAKNEGKTASLLDQQRPNIFTQSVANILPNEKILIEISYVETLKFEDGAYEFVFPMTVGPRYVPATNDEKKQQDAQIISPPIDATRAGHDISIEVNLDAGTAVEAIRSTTHEIQTSNLSATGARISLKDGETIPNKDFVLRYDVTGQRIADAFLTHKDERGGFFTLMLQPPDKFSYEDVTPKEIVFVLDTSGSMQGFPIEKAKEAMRASLENLYPYDTFNVITFAGDTRVLFEKPVPATQANLETALAFLDTQEGGGGTEMMKAIQTALAPTDSQEHIRVVCFMTDGYVGNENEIIAEVQKHPNARVFSFGIGSSVNRFLLDKMAEEGRGEVEYVSLKDDGSAAARRFQERVRSPLLTDISIDFGNLSVADVYPKRINDLFSAKPLIVHGRFTKSGSGTIRLRGKSFGREIVREIQVNFPENEPNHDVLSTLWARTRIDDLMSQDYTGTKPEIKEAITNIGIEYRLLTPFTSFVAVEERVVTDGGQPRKIEVPVELPEGVSGSATIDQSDTKISTNLTQQSVQSLPNGTQFSSILKVSPNARPEALSGGFQVDGAAGSENVFVIDGTEVTNFRTGAVNKNNSVPLNFENNGGRLTGAATKLPKPVVSSIKGWDGKDNLVNVRVTIDGVGNIMSATAESGNQLLREASEKAAQSSKFKISQPSTSPILITGVIVYSYSLDGKKIKVEVSLKDFALKISPEEQKRRVIAAKTSTAIFKLIERLKDVKSQPDAEEAKFVADGKAEILIRLKELKPETIEELKKAGFEVLTEVAAIKGVVGRIAIEKLAALAELDAVTFISPQNR